MFGIDRSCLRGLYNQSTTKSSGEVTRNPPTRSRLNLASGKIRIQVNDYAGHPFQIDLSRELARRGHEVSHLYCSTNVTPRADLSSGERSPRIIAISTGVRFEKYNISRRMLAELRYGIKSARYLIRCRPSVVMSSNMPLVSLAIIQLVAAITRTRTVIWLQDFQSGLAALALGDASHPIARLLRRLEQLLVRSAGHVVCISNEFRAELALMGREHRAVTTIENWSPIEDLPTRPRDNKWAADHGLIGKVVYLYSGTLGIKHRPESLIALAEALATTEQNSHVVVVSEGVGADWLRREQAKRTGITNLTILPFQEFEQLPDVMGAADVLIVLLEPMAGRFSVPSKVLSYLCAGRPIVALVPNGNAVFSLVTTSGAGIATEDEQEMVRQAIALGDDERQREVAGHAGRAWAERNFRIGPIANRFESILAV